MPWSFNEAGGFLPRKLLDDLQTMTPSQLRLQ